MAKIKYHEFASCEICGATPAIYRRFAKKTLCKECAKKAFKKYMAIIMISATSITLFFIF